MAHRSHGHKATSRSHLPIAVCTDHVAHRFVVTLTRIRVRSQIEWSPYLPHDLGRARRFAVGVHGVVSHRRQWRWTLWAQQRGVGTACAAAFGVHFKSVCIPQRLSRTTVLIPPRRTRLEVRPSSVRSGGGAPSKGCARVSAAPTDRIPAFINGDMYSELSSEWRSTRYDYRLGLSISFLNSSTLSPNLANLNS